MPLPTSANVCPGYAPHDAWARRNATAFHTLTPIEP